MGSAKVFARGPTRAHRRVDLSPVSFFIPTSHPRNHPSCRDGIAIPTANGDRTPVGPPVASGPHRRVRRVIRIPHIIPSGLILSP